MEIERKPVDLVFVVGPTQSNTKRAISRFIRRVSKSSNGFKVASIHFTNNYDSKLGNNVFLSRTIDFTATSSSSKISELPQVQGNPLQHVTKLSFRENAVKICFFMSKYTSECFFPLCQRGFLSYCREITVVKCNIIQRYTFLLVAYRKPASKMLLAN